MAEEYVIKFVSDDFKSGVDTATGTGGGSVGGGGGGSIKGGMGKLIGLGTGIAAGIKILAEVAGETLHGLLKPVMSILKGIVKLVGELLRPIVEIVVIMLRPILALIRPIVQMVRTMLAPFMQIAREFAGMASQQMVQGNLGAAIELSLQAAKAIIAPFVIVILGVALELATTAIMQGLGFLISMVLEMMASVVEHIPGIGGRIADSLRSVGGTVSDLASEASNAAIGKIREGTQWVLDEMLESSKSDLENAKNKFGVTYDSVMIETPLGLLESAAGDSSAAMEEGFTKPINQALLTMGVGVNNRFGSTGSVTTMFSNGLDTMQTAVSSFVTALNEEAGRLSSTGGRKKLFGAEYTIGGRTLGWGIS